MIIHACCSDDDISVLSFMPFSTEGLYSETGSCKFWFYVSVLRLDLIILQVRKKAVNVHRGVAWWGRGRGVHPDCKMNILNGNIDFLHTKNLGNMKENSKNIFFKSIISLRGGHCNFLPGCQNKNVAVPVNVSATSLVSDVRLLVACYVVVFMMENVH
jgi:hypothetical protein